MNIGKSIYNKRKQLNLTQEQLADAVGVSIPAVSKWETGTTLPDITLLAPIARKLQTDVNSLMNFQENISDWEVDKLIEEMLSITASEGFTLGSNKGFYYINQYPNNNYLKLKVASHILLNQQMVEIDCTEDEYTTLCVKCEKLLMEVYNNPHPDDAPVLNIASIGTLVNLYMRNNRLDEAEQLLSDISEPLSNPREMLKHVYFQQENYDDAKNLAQRELITDSLAFVSDIHLLFNIAKNTGDYDLASKYARDYYAITTAFKNPSFMPSDPLFRLEIAKKNYINASEYFSKVIDEILESVHIYDESPYYDTVKDSISTWNSTMSNSLVEHMYEALRADEELVEFYKTKGTLATLERLVTETR